MAQTMTFHSLESTIVMTGGTNNDLSLRSIHDLVVGLIMTGASNNDLLGFK